MLARSLFESVFVYTITDISCQNSIAISIQVQSTFIKMFCFINITIIYEANVSGAAILPQFLIHYAGFFIEHFSFFMVVTPWAKARDDN